MFQEKTVYVAKYSLASIDDEKITFYKGGLRFEKNENDKLFGTDFWKEIDRCGCGGKSIYNYEPFVGQQISENKFTLLVGDGIEFDCLISSDKKNIKALFKDTKTGDIGKIDYTRINL